MLSLLYSIALLTGVFILVTGVSMIMGLAIAWLMCNGRDESYIIGAALLNAWIISGVISTFIFYVVFKIGGLV